MSRLEIVFTQSTGARSLFKSWMWSLDCVLSQWGKITTYRLWLHCLHGHWGMKQKLGHSLTPHYGPFVRGIHQRPMDSLNIGPGKWKKYPYHDRTVVARQADRGVTLTTNTPFGMKRSRVKYEASASSKWPTRPYTRITFQFYRQFLGGIGYFPPYIGTPNQNNTLTQRHSFQSVSFAPRYGECFCYFCCYKWLIYATFAIS